MQWAPETDIYCSLDGKTKSYCTPESYDGTSPVLYRNDGGGKFTNVTKEAGLHNPRGKGLGVAASDSVGNVEIVWPNGERQKVEGLEPGKIHVIEER